MILRKGTRGNEVKLLQEFLGTSTDGIFGSGTEVAVKKWQSDNGLIADGIVGSATWDSMGLATTDVSEKTYTTKNGLVINRHFLPEGQYKEGPINPEYLFLHHTAGWNNPYKTIDSWGRDKRGSVATEFVLGGQSVKGDDETYDGDVVQSFQEGNYGWHLGKNGSQYMHKNSVGVEVNSFGYIKDGKTYAGTRVHESQITTLETPFKGYKTWHKYSNKQIESLRLLILHIGDRDGIDIRAGLPALIKEIGAKAFEFNEDAYYGRVKGMWTHTNTRKDKFDMFPQPELLDMLVSL
tara:strand:+ start:6848 stop:7729 length:882 start_codon:yes stop_codon:yes gene_type:complete